MTRMPAWTRGNVDRLLGLADQFLDDWAEDAVQSGQRDTEYEARSAEWTAIRPILVVAPELLKGLQAIVDLCSGSSEPTARCCRSLARAAMSYLDESLRRCPAATRLVGDGPQTDEVIEEDGSSRSGALEGAENSQHS